MNKYNVEVLLHSTPAPGSKDVVVFVKGISTMDFTIMAVDIPDCVGIIFRHLVAYSEDLEELGHGEHLTVTDLTVSRVQIQV